LINEIFKYFQRPDNGWDPVPIEYAVKYSERSWENIDTSMLEKIVEITGSLKDKTILDLGGGPGQYSVAFAQLGGHVTWLDVSRNYLNIANDKAIEHNVDINFILAYMDDAERLIGANSCEFIFNRICWYYCVNDKKFASSIVNMLKKGGYAYLDIFTYDLANISFTRRLLQKLYFLTKYKFGHLLPRQGQISTLFRKFEDIEIVPLDSTDRNERFIIIKY